MLIRMDTGTVFVPAAAVHRRTAVRAYYNVIPVLKTLMTIITFHTDIIHKATPVNEFVLLYSPIP